jgi:SAM-dependent methyltransferase
MIKDFIRRLVPRAILEGIQRLRRFGKNDSKNNSAYERAVLPGSQAYENSKRLLLEQTINAPKGLTNFRVGGKLPKGYGVGIDERCVEYPWLLSKLPIGTQRLLDAGSALNHEFLLDHPVIRDKSLHILTLAPEAGCYWQKGISYLFDDLRSIPIRDDYYDFVACISTLEHVGCDNTVYTGNPGHAEDQTDQFEIVMRELRRVLKPGGTLFLTVPFGAYKNHGLFQQFDRNLLTRAIKAFGDTRQVEEFFFHYHVEGWNWANASECFDCQFVDWIIQAWQRNEWPDPPPVEPDLAVAARAIACVQLVKL